MQPDDLQEFLILLEQVGELSRVRCPVDADLEVSAIINAVCKERGGGKALLFENVKGAVLPLAANLFGSARRMEMALGTGMLAAAEQKLRADLAMTGAESATAALRMLVSPDRLQAVLVVDAPCFAREVTDRGLEALPALRAWPGDGGRYLTLGQVVTRHPDTGVENCGMYRLQIAGRDRVLLRCHPGSGGAEHLQAWHQRGEAMPVAIALGGPPILTWLAGLPLPEGVTETSFAGYLNDRPLRLGRCRETGLAVPAAAEIVIEGWVHPTEELPEGPFGNHTGRYVPASPAPVIRVTRISLRQAAVCPCTLVGPPPMENRHLAEQAAHILLPLLQFDHPWVSALYLPPESIYHRAAMVAVADDCGLSAADIGRALRSSLLLKNARLLVVLDSDTPLHDAHQVFWRVINAGPWPPLHHSDGGRVILDARTPAGEQRVAVADHTGRFIAQRWREYGL